MAGDGERESSDRCENAQSPFPETHKNGKDLGTVLFHGIVEDTVAQYNEYYRGFEKQSKTDPDAAKAMFAEFVAGMKCGDPVDVHLTDKNDLNGLYIDFTAESFVGSVFDILNKLKTQPTRDHSTDPPVTPERAASVATEILQSEMTKYDVNDSMTRDDIIKDFNRLSKEKNLSNYIASEGNGVVVIQFVGTDL
jgi:hypothetical protein